MTIAAVSMLYATVPDRDTAANIGRSLIEAGLCACVNIVPGMESIYRWQGQIETAHETVLIIKCASSAVPTITAHIKTMHPYDLPAILSWSIDAGHPPFLAWVARAGQ